MKKSLRIVLAMMALLAGGAPRALAQNTYYWFGGGLTGGSGNWDVKENWKILSPGVPAGTLISSINDSRLVTAGSQPTANDDVLFNLAPFGSNASARTVTIRTGAEARNINWTGARNSPTFRVDGPLTIAGSLTFIPNMSFPATTNGSVTFTAPGQATITSADKIFAMPVTFNGPTSSTQSSWVLQDDMTVSGAVTFTRGIVVAKPLASNADVRPGANGVNHTAPASPRFVFNASPVVNASSNSSHVDGYIHLKNARGATSNVQLPIGDGTYRRTLALVDVSNAPGNPSEFIIRYFGNMSPGLINPAMPTAIEQGSALTSVGDKEYWYVSNQSGPASYRFIVSYNHPLLPNYYRPDVPQGLTYAGLNIANRWVDMGREEPNTADGTIQIRGQAKDYKWFTIGRTDNVGLPVRLVSFSAQGLDGQVKLKWQSAEEKNTAHFEVERSADGKNFSPLLTQQAQGNSAALVSYNAIDSSPLHGTSYYRLKMVDLDGSYEHSKIVSVSTEGGVLVRAYPNPSNGREVRFLAPNGDKLVLQSVTDAFGKAVGYETTDVYAEGLYVSFYGSLPAGFYVAALVTNDDKRERVRVKFVVQ